MGRGAFVLNAGLSLALCAIMLAATAFPFAGAAGAFDLSGAVRSCEQYAKPGQGGAHLECIRTCVDSLAVFVSSEWKTYGHQKTECGMHCVESFRARVAECVGYSREFEDVAPCFSEALNAGNSCAKDCGYPTPAASKTD